MTDDLKIIKKTISEHRKIRERLDQTGDSLTDIEALFMLNKTLAGWSQSSISEFQNKRTQLLNALKTLEKGLKHHFAYEEKAMPPLLGEVLMKNIIGDHRKITGLIKKAENEIKGAGTKGLGQAELLAEKTKIQGNIHQILAAVEEHASHEETILTAIKQAVEGITAK
jgi:hypothetical protein